MKLCLSVRQERRPARGRAPRGRSSATRSMAASRECALHAFEDGVGFVGDALAQRFRAAKLLGVVNCEVALDIGAQLGDARIIHEVQRRCELDDRPHVLDQAVAERVLHLAPEVRRNSRRRVAMRVTGSCKRSSRESNASLTVPRRASSALRRTAAISSSERFTRKSSVLGTGR
jgi:hypothetical protein